MVAQLKLPQGVWLIYRARIGLMERSVDQLLVDEGVVCGSRVVTSMLVAVVVTG